MKKSIIFVALLAIPIGTSAWAADCVVHVKRAACAGQERILQERDGAAECDTAEAEAASEAACAKVAAGHCDNKRLDVTKSKVVTATFKATPLTGGFAIDGKADAKGQNSARRTAPT